MHEREAVEEAHLVALQVADEVPAHRHVDRLHLRQRFLHAVLAHVVDAGLPRGADRLGAVRLRDGDERDALAMPAARDRAVDPSPRVGDARREV